MAKPAISGRVDQAVSPVVERVGRADRPGDTGLHRQVAVSVVWGRAWTGALCTGRAATGRDGASPLDLAGAIRWGDWGEAIPNGWTSENLLQAMPIG